MPPTLQYVERHGVLDLAWGHPRPELLPVRTWRDCQQEALDAYTWRAMTYGYAAGPGPLVEWLCERVAQVDTRAPTPGELFVTAGSSQALELLSSVLTSPGDTVLVESPTYHLALRILADRDVSLVAAPSDEAGIDPAATSELLRRLRAAGRRVPLLYLVPTFGNPTGSSLPADRRLALVEVAAEAGVTILEDDAYRELGFGPGAPPPSLWSLAGGRGVIRLGTFSKTAGPGLRLGWITASPPIVRSLVDRGFVDSGGGLNHTTALTMAVMGRSGRYATHVDHLRAAYRVQRDALVAALRTGLPIPVDPPGGGWFLWLRLPGGLTATSLLAAAEARHVSFLPGHRCYLDATADDHIRLSFSMHEPSVLAEAAARLAAAFPAAG